MRICGVAGLCTHFRAIKMKMNATNPITEKNYQILKKLNMVAAYNAMEKMQKRSGATPPLIPASVSSVRVL